MRLYISDPRKTSGRVYHLDEHCPLAAVKVEVTPALRREYARRYGMRRICIRCRKAAAKEGR